VGYHAWEAPTDAQILARMKARRLALTVACVGAVPVPVGPEPQALEALGQVVAEIERFGIYGAAVPAAKALVKRAGELVTENAALRARVAELEAERHSTNEALSDAAEALRANRDRIAELEALKPAEIQTRRDVSPRAEKLRALLAGQRASLEDPHDGPLAHRYRIPRDLPETGGAGC
jgi:hypothetical protein